MTPTGHRPEPRPGPRADEDRAAPAVTLADDALTIHHPAVHERAQMEVGFQRTLRVPDDGHTYPLPAGLGRFPVRHVEDYADRLPPAMRRRGGVLVPMHRAEALWINLPGGRPRSGAGSWPMAVQVATGKICAVSGAPWRDELARSPRQNYVTVPEQPWLDGYAVAKGMVRQFVAVPLGEGATAEEQLSGRAEWGGIQMQAFPLRREQWERERGEWLSEARDVSAVMDLCSIGLAPGGRIRQEIYEDQRPLSHWDQLSPARVFIHLVSAEDWPRITGEAPPPTPITRETYEKHGIPWFDHYRSDLSPVGGGGPLAGLESTGELGVTQDAPIDPPGTKGKGAPGPVLPTGPSRRPRKVRSGEF